MPVRPEEEGVDYHFGYLNKTIKLSRKSYEDLLYLQSIEVEFNKESDKLAEEIKTSIEASNFTVVARSFNRLYEGAGFEKISPRNYLTKEVIEVSINSNKEVYFLGSFGTNEEAKYHIIKSINDKYGKRVEQRAKRKDGRGIRIDRETIESIRLRFRKR